MGFVRIAGFLAAAAAVYFFVPWQTVMWVVVGLAAFIALEALVIVKGGRCERPVWGYRDSRLRLFRVRLGRLKNPENDLHEIQRQTTA